MKTKKRISPRRGRGTIGALVLLFLASAAIRVATSADVVLAEISQFDDTPPAKKAETDAPTYESLGALLETLQTREARIERQEAQINRRMAALQDADTKINAKLAELKAAEEQLKSTIALASTAAENDLARLTAVYENMKPKVAAALFSEMDPDFAAGFLARMRADSAAAVLAGMKPERAYTISAILAGRNADVPKE